MNSIRAFSLLLIPFSLAFSSCGDDPKLVEKKERQKAEIARLKGELSLIEEKLKDVPPDVSTQLAEAKLLSVKQSADIADLESQIAELEARRRSLQTEYDSYRVKYQVK